MGVCKYYNGPICQNTTSTTLTAAAVNCRRRRNLDRCSEKSSGHMATTCEGLAVDVDLDFSKILVYHRSSFSCRFSN